MAVATATCKSNRADSDELRVLPRPPHMRRRPTEDRGLPGDEEIAKLATEYQNRQRNLWAQLVEAGLFSEPTPAVIAGMVEDFKHRHRTGDVSIDTVAPFASVVKDLGGSYSRYSCDNSKPNSIIDQTNKNLDKAAEEGRFIPWSYVFADFSVTGLSTSRVGYTSYKKVLKDPAHKIETTYIDDFTRASRDEIEWWRLAHVIRILKKRLIGSSDGFDLNSVHGEMLIGIYNILSRLFIKSLREKVRRGMGGAAERGTVLGKLPIGLTRRVRLDEHGREVLNPDGTSLTEPCIDPNTALIVAEIVDMYVNQKLSVYKIARILNERNADNWNRWTGSRVFGILRSASLIGVLIWNRQRSEYDFESERLIKVDNPRSEWKVHFDKNLALISMDLYRKLRRRLARLRPPKGSNEKPMSRNQLSASTLFSGTLICGHCEEELSLYRSKKTHKNLYCSRGREHIGGCKLTTTKSIRIIETALLSFIQERILTEENVKALVIKANAYLEELAAQPQVDIKPVKAELRRIEQKISRLVRLVEDEPDDKTRHAYHKRVKELRTQADQKSKELRRLTPTNGRTIKPLDEATVLLYLKDMRELLNQDIPVAAEALRTLTGPIKITQQETPERKHSAAWVASFTPRLFDFLQQVVKEKNASNTMSFEPIKGRLAATSEIVHIPIRQKYKYEELAPIFLEMEESGMTASEITRKFKMHDKKQVLAILDFARTGRQPDWTQTDAKTASGPGKE
jgi:site-specific DNA recombinase